jgi:hypothetical protein
MRHFWICRISLLSQKTKNFYKTKLFAVTKFVKQGITVRFICEIQVTETQLTSGSAFIPENVIWTGHSSSFAFDNTSAFIVPA